MTQDQEKKTETSDKQAEKAFKKPDLTRELSSREIDQLKAETGKEKVYQINVTQFDDVLDDEVEYFFYQTMPNKGQIGRYTSSFANDVTKASRVLVFDTSLNDKAALTKFFERYPNGGIAVANQINRLTGIGANASLKKR